MFKLYLCYLNGTEFEVPEEILSDYRKEKLSRQRAPQIRAQSAAAELLLRFALSDSGFAIDTPLEIGTVEHGKPFLKSGECSFSLSHSSDAVLCALCDTQIGADIQLVSRADPALIARFFAEDEQRYVFSSADRDAAFTEIWTKKESWCKLTGRGLTLPFPSFSVLDETTSRCFRHARAGKFHFCVAAYDGLPERIEPIVTDMGALRP